MPRYQWHAAACKAVKTGMTFFTSSLVINEVVSLLQSRGNLSAALLFLERIRQSGDVHIVHPDPVSQAEGWDLFRRWGGGGANAVDCVSFAIMGSFGIRSAFTFDQRFRARGYQTLSTRTKS